MNQFLALNARNRQRRWPSVQEERGKIGKARESGEQHQRKTTNTTYEWNPELVQLGKNDLKHLHVICFSCWIRNYSVRNYIHLLKNYIH